MGRWFMTGVLASASLWLYAAPVHAKESLIPEGIYAGELSLEGLSKEEAFKRLKAEVQKLLSTEVILEMDDIAIAASAEGLGVRWANPELLDETMQRLDGNLIQQYMKREDLKREPIRLHVDLTADEAELEKYVLEHCTEFLPKPVNARIVRKEGGFEITAGQVGRGVDLAGTKEAIEKLFSSSDIWEKRGRCRFTLKAVMRDLQPDISSDMLSSIHDVLGSYNTDFGSSSVSRAGNLKNGSSKIDGKVLMPGETLSGYECMHPFTTENGYYTAAAYENGQVVDSVGGGVCQIATTLYNAALRAELKITQRQNHSMVVGYVEPSMDAAIAGTYKDIKITNNYSTPIYIEGGTSGTSLYFTIYGKETRPANRSISFVSETISTTSPGAPTKRLDHSLAPGSSRQVQSAHIGKRSRLWKIVAIDGNETERTILHEDTYNPAKAIILVGPEVKRNPAERDQPAETRISTETGASEVLPPEEAEEASAEGRQRINTVKDDGMPPDERTELTDIEEMPGA